MNSLARYFALVTTVGYFLSNQAQAQVGNNNPTGVSGDYNGVVTTAGSYDPFTGNASREIEDIVVAGSVGAYPLTWTRRLNTRAMPSEKLSFGQAGGWSHSYEWDLRIYHPAAPTPTPPGGTPDPYPDGVLTYADGRTAELIEPWEPACCDGAEDGPFGRKDRIVANGQGRDLRLADGGIVKFTPVPGSVTRFVASEIMDPYGLVTQLWREPGTNRLTRIVEPGGRYLEIFYEAQPNPPWGTLYFIGRVEANDGRGNVTQRVRYTYERKNFTHSVPLYYLTRVDYDTDGTHAKYLYQASNFPPLYTGDVNAVKHGLIQKCEDVRFKGPMKTIEYFTK